VELGIPCANDRTMLGDRSPSGQCACACAAAAGDERSSTGAGE
jgi:hypothetical protein